MEYNEEEIMLAYHLGDKEAVVKIFELYQNKVLNFCLRILGNRADAEDVTADVFMAVFERKYAYDPRAKFTTWLFTVARNSCITRLRRKKNFVSMWFTSAEDGAVDVWEIPDSSQISRDELQKKEMGLRVRQAIQKLPMEQKEALILREYHQLSYEQISQILGCSLEKVKILIFRARENLKGQLLSFVKEDER